jgi:hypothetical protein
MFLLGGLENNYNREWIEYNTIASNSNLPSCFVD